MCASKFNTRAVDNLYYALALHQRRLFCWKFHNTSSQVTIYARKSSIKPPYTLYDRGPHDQVRSRPIGGKAQRHAFSSGPRVVLFYCSRFKSSTMVVFVPLWLSDSNNERHCKYMLSVLHQGIQYESMDGRRISPSFRYSVDPLLLLHKLGRCAVPD